MQIQRADTVELLDYELLPVRLHKTKSNSYREQARIVKQRLRRYFDR